MSGFPLSDPAAQNRLKSPFLMHPDFMTWPTSLQVFSPINCRNSHRRASLLKLKVQVDAERLDDAFNCTRLHSTSSAAQERAPFPGVQPRLSFLLVLYVRTGLASGSCRICARWGRRSCALTLCDDHFYAV